MQFETAYLLIQRKFFIYISGEETCFYYENKYRAIYGWKLAAVIFLYKISKILGIKSTDTKQLIEKLETFKLQRSYKEKLQ